MLKIYALLVGLGTATALATAGGCGGTATGGDSSSAATGGGGGGTLGCPREPDGGWSYESLPSGACLGSSSCQIALIGHCPDGTTVPGTQWQCDCLAGSWQCGAGLNFTPCPDGGGLDGG